MNFQEHEHFVHFAAHFGVSFAIQISLYGLNRLGMSRGASLGLAVVETLAIGFTYKASEGFPENTVDAMIQNSLGVAAATVVAYRFKF